MQTLRDQPKLGPRFSVSVAKVVFDRISSPSYGAAQSSVAAFPVWLCKMFCRIPQGRRADPVPPCGGPQERAEGDRPCASSAPAPGDCLGSAREASEPQGVDRPSSTPLSQDGGQTVRRRVQRWRRLTSDRTWPGEVGAEGAYLSAPRPGGGGAGGRRRPPGRVDSQCPRRAARPTSASVRRISKRARESARGRAADTPSAPAGSPAAVAERGWRKGQGRAGSGRAGAWGSSLTGARPRPLSGAAAAHHQFGTIPPKMSPILSLWQKDRRALALSASSPGAAPAGRSRARGRKGSGVSGRPRIRSQRAGPPPLPPTPAAPPRRPSRDHRGAQVRTAGEAAPRGTHARPTLDLPHHGRARRALGTHPHFYLSTTGTLPGRRRTARPLAGYPLSPPNEAERGGRREGHGGLNCATRGRCVPGRKRKPGVTSHHTTRGRIGPGSAP